MPQGVWATAACIAVAFPSLLAYNVSPSATFLNQVAAFIGWGAFLVLVGAAMAASTWPRSRGALALLASVGLIVLATLGASLWQGAPWPLSLSAVGTMLAAVLVIAAAAAAARAGLARKAFTAFCIALVVAGIASSAIGLIQVFAPALPDGDWIAPASIVGRATGNLRQPNHLSSLLLWSAVAAIWLGEARVIYREIAWMLTLLFIEVIVLSASRTGLLGMFALLGWGLLDRRLSRSTRIALLLSPLAYLALWEASALLSHQLGLSFGGEERLSGKGLYVSYSRFAIWKNALSMIAQHPWLGVGFGEFNFAWTLTPFPDRPVAFFDHAHNIALQFGAELGIPLTLVVLGLMGYALREAWLTAEAEGREPGARFSRLSGRPTDEPVPEDASTEPLQPVQRAALVMVLMVGVHSLLEYPLWYAYFLLPAAFAFGLCLERPDERDTAIAAADEGRITRPLVLAAMALIFGATVALWDYARVVIIFSPPAKAASLEQRIADGRHSLFFAHHADYAAATVPEHPGKAIDAFRRAPHFLLDARLMLAWAKALDESGQTDKARYVAARLKEFRNDQADEFFAACDAPDAVRPAAAASGASASAPAPAASAPPYQCQAPKGAYTYKDFR